MSVPVCNRWSIWIVLSILLWAIQISAQDVRVEGTWLLQKAEPQGTPDAATMATFAKSHPEGSILSLLADGTALFVYNPEKKQPGTWKINGNILILQLRGGRGHEGKMLTYAIVGQTAEGLQLEHCLPTPTGFTCYRTDWIPGAVAP